MSKTFLFQVIQFSQTVLIQTILFSRSIVFVQLKLNVKTVLFQVIQFNINTQFSSIWAIDKSLSGTTTPGQSEPGSDSNEGVRRIPLSSRITRSSPLDCLVSYSVEFYISVEMQWVYSTTPADRTKFLCRWGPYNFARLAINLKFDVAETLITNFLYIHVFLSDDCLIKTAWNQGS